MHPAFEENLWVIATRAPDAPGQWLARCLNLDVVSMSSTLDGALRAAAEAVAYCLGSGARSRRRRAPLAEWDVLEQLVREGSGGEPPREADVAVAAQLQLVPASASAGEGPVRRLPSVWLERAALRRSPAPARLWPWPRPSANRRAEGRRRRRSARCGSACPSWANTRGVTVSSAPEIIVTTQDFERLQRIVACTDSLAAERLDAELARARLVAQTEIPSDEVTMNSDVVYEDAASGEQRSVRLVYPRDAQATLGRVSVLAPVGSALLGLRAGQSIDWPTPRGVRRLRVLEVPYQPERHGDWTL